jgi:molybdopterin-guanine dinucleotide biosynthesis protein A
MEAPNYLDRSAIILTGGPSSEVGKEKGLLKLENKPLLTHVTDAVKEIVDEVIVVTRSQELVNLYANVVLPDVLFSINTYEPKGPLVAALTGFEAAQGKHSLLLPYNSPFVSRDLISLLFELCIGKSAVISRWPNGQIEPLHAVYDTKQTLEVARKAIANNELDMKAMTTKLQGVRYVSTLVIEQLDPDFRTFFTINNPIDLKKATNVTKARKR